VKTVKMNISRERENTIRFTLRNMDEEKNGAGEEKKW
jgi:hypothetical protein